MPERTVEGLKHDAVELLAGGYWTSAVQVIGDYCVRRVLEELRAAESIGGHEDGTHTVKVWPLIRKP